MALLHYRLSKFACAWIVSCEGVPIERFNTRAAAVQAAEHLMKTARSRGDKPFIHLDKEPPTHKLGGVDSHAG